LIVLVRPERLGALLRKEKDGASRLNHFQADSLNAFIPRFAGVWRFFYFQKSSDPALVFPIEKLSASFFTQTN
jgi:hypothetical protein